MNKIKSIIFLIAILNGFAGFSQHFNTIKFKEAPVEEQVLTRADIEIFSPPLSLYIQNYFLPLDTLIVKRGFGYSLDPISHKIEKHMGVVLETNYDSVFVVEAGEIMKVGNDKHIGKFIIVDHEGHTSIYGHLSKVFYAEGDRVFAGTAIALSGTSGRTYGNSLYFAIKKKKLYIDPFVYFKESGNM